MLNRAFNVVGLIVRIAEWKAYLLALSARRSALAMLGYLVAAVLALGGLAVLLGAGYVALETIVGVPIAMAGIGAFLLIIASIIWIVTNHRAMNTAHPMTEHEALMNTTRDEEQLRSILGLNTSDAKPGDKRPAQRVPSMPSLDSINGLDNPKVMMAAGFALLGLLGPVRLFRTVRIATALASVTALANRAINEHQEKQGKQ